MTTDNEMQGLMKEFQSISEVPGAEGLLRRAKRERRKQALMLLQELLASAALLGFYGVVLVRSHEPVIVVLAMASTLFIGVWLTHLFLDFKGTWRAETETTAAFLRLTLNRREAAVRWSAFVRRALVALSMGGTLWILWKLRVDWDLYAREPWRAVLGIGGFFGILGFLAIYSARKAKKARLELEAFVSTQAGYQEEEKHPA